MERVIYSRNSPMNDSLVYSFLRDPGASGSLPWTHEYLGRWRNDCHAAGQHGNAYSEPGHGGIYQLRAYPGHLRPDEHSQHLAVRLCRKRYDHAA